MWESSVLDNNFHRLKKLTNNGFTLVELNVSITILTILVVGLLASFTNFFGLIYSNNKTIDMTVDAQTILRTMVEELRYGAGVRSTSSLADSNAPAGGWNTSNTNFVIIIAVPAITSSNTYIINPSTGNPYLNELVYFKSDKTLYKRVLAHPDASGNSLKTTCPANLATTNCPADRKLGEDVENMVFTLYDQDDAITADPLLARSVHINLFMQGTALSNPLDLNIDVRVTQRNSF